MKQLRRVSGGYVWRTLEPRRITVLQQDRLAEFQRALFKAMKILLILAGIVLGLYVLFIVGMWMAVAGFVVAMGKISPKPPRRHRRRCW